MKHAQAIKDYEQAIKNIKFPTVEITIGRFTVPYTWLPWMGAFNLGAWCEDEPDGFDDAPEHKHLEKVSDALIAGHSDEEYMDELIAALASNPFTTEED